MKKLKQNLILVVIMTIPVFLYSQKPEKNRIGDYKYTQLPIKPFSEDFKTYLVTASSFDSYREDNIIAGIDIIGFDKNRGENADFKVNVKEYEFRTTEPKRLTEKKSRKVNDKDVAYTLISYSFELTYKIKVKLLDMTGNIILEHSVSRENKKYYSPKTENSKAAYDDYKKYLKDIKAKVYKESLQKVNNYLNSQVGYPKKTQYIFLYTVKPKKYDYDDYTTAFESAEEAMDALKSDENAISENENKLKSALKIWEDALLKFDPDEKKARINKKVATISYHNIAMCYFVMKQYDKARENLENLDEIDDTFKTTLHIIEKCKNLEKRVEANK